MCIFGIQQFTFFFEGQHNLVVQNSVCSAIYQLKTLVECFSQMVYYDVQEASMYTFHLQTAA